MVHPSANELDSTKKLEQLRRDWEEAKRKRESANTHRKEAHASLQAAQEAAKDEGDVCLLKLKLKKARRCHVKAVKEERRLFQELNAAQESAVGAHVLENTKEDTTRESNKIISPQEDDEDAQGNNLVEVQTQRKRKRTSDQYLKYKERDDMFREWVSSVCSIDLDPVDNLLLAMDTIHDNILQHCFDVEIPDFVIKNLDRSIELRLSEAERYYDSDEGHIYYVSVLQRCSQRLRDCRAIKRGNKEDDATDYECERATKRRRLAK